MLGPKPSDEWFVSDGGKVSGPFTAARLRDLKQWGRLSDKALLCDAYQSAWLPLRQSPLAPILCDEPSPNAPPEPPSALAPLDPALGELALVAMALVLAGVVSALAP
jgi:hypothetical protein